MSDSSKGTSSQAKKARRRRMEIQRLRSGGISSSPELTSELETHPNNPGNSSAESSGSGETVGAAKEEEVGARGKGLSENKLAGSFVYGHVSMMGRRRVMEDAVTVERVAGEYFFAVYDGHGGAKVAETCSERLHKCLEKSIQEAKKMTDDHEKEFDWKRVMVECFEAIMDEEFEEDRIGSKAVVVLLGKENMVVANCGDSKAVLCRGGVAVPLSRDHKPERAEEEDERVEDAGGRKTNWCVQGLFPTSRSNIPDLKPYGISEPEVSIERRTESDEFLIIATDGLWDVVSSEIACEVVKKRINDEQIITRLQSEGSGGASEAAATLVELAIAKGSKDNITVIVVQFK